MRSPQAGPGPETLIVTGHPNHELAILGMVQRARPHLLVVTDGGQPERVADSRRVFESLDLSDRVRFLDFPEVDLYRALLERDLRTLLGLVADIRAVVDRVKPRQILCESVEFYNPLHDLTLPFATAAARHLPNVAMLEFPLIAEIPESGGRFRVQRPPASREGASETFNLSPDELSVKRAAAAHSYPSLRRQLGELIDGIGSEHAAKEYYLSATSDLPVPGAEHALRYEERGRVLQKEGAVDHVITFQDHFLPAVAALERSSPS